MLGSGPRGVKAKRALSAVLACAVLVAGCWWRSYPERMRTHADVLVGIARKARDLVASGRFTAESLPELTYPLERAAAFAADGRRRTDTPPPSLAAFETLLARYRTFVERVDDARRAPRDAEAGARLAEPLAAVERAAEDVYATLAREADSGPR